MQLELSASGGPLVAGLLRVPSAYVFPQVLHILVNSDFEGKEAKIASRTSNRNLLRYSKYQRQKYFSQTSRN